MDLVSQTLVRQFLGPFCEKARRRQDKRGCFEAIFDNRTKNSGFQILEISEIWACPPMLAISCSGLNEQLHCSILPLDAWLMELAEST